MRIRFWGTRGSIANAGPEHGPLRRQHVVRRGAHRRRHAARARLRHRASTGSGQRAASRRPRRGAPPPAAILIGHTHWDHIQGLPFFAPLFVPGNRWDVYGPRGLGASLDNALAGQMQYTYFPVALDESPPTSATTTSSRACSRSTTPRSAPSTSTTRRSRWATASRPTARRVVYATDHEPHDASLAGGGRPAAGQRRRARHAEFLARRRPAHPRRAVRRRGVPRQGGLGPQHGGVRGRRWPRAAGVGRLALFHHDPLRDDDAVDDLLGRARALAASEGTALQVDAAAEGSVLEIRGAHRPSATRGCRGHVVPAMDDLAVGVAIATGDPELEAAVEAAATAEGLRVRPAREQLADAWSLSTSTAGRHPSDRRQLRRARRNPAGHPVAPISGITDWIVLPASIAHIRTKLRAAVLRRACRWLAAPVAPEEERRLAALQGLGMLDTPT